MSDSLGLDDRDEGNTVLVEISYEHILRKARDSVLFSIEDRDVWIPRSRLNDWDEQLKTFSIPEWLAIDREVV